MMGHNVPKLLANDSLIPIKAAAVGIKPGNAALLGTFNHFLAQHRAADRPAG